MGKASDLHIYGGTGDREKNANAVRDLLVKYSGAKYRWNDQNVIALEADNRNGTASDFKASTWVHYDVRTFELKYLDDKYFAKTMTDCNGKNMVLLANELGFQKTCLCNPAKPAAVEVPKTYNKGECFCDKDLTAQNLIDIGVSSEKASIFLEAINKTFTDYKITSCLRKAHFLAQVIHESGGFRYTEEIDVPDTAYGGYKGRGLMQLTGKNNYEAYGEYENEDFTSSLKNKKRLEELPFSARLAGWFWTESAKLNDYADLNDHINVTRVINGGFNGYNDRTKYLKKGFKLLYNNCKNDSGKDTIYEFNLSKAYNNKRGAFAWGLWHDPDLKKDGCTKDKQKSIEGYTRFIELAGVNYDEIDWYNINKISSLNNLKYTIGKTSHIKVIDAAKQRLEQLKK